jgi:hypothetical protein
MLLPSQLETKTMMMTPDDTRLFFVTGIVSMMTMMRQKEDCICEKHPQMLWCSLTATSRQDEIGP